MKVQNLFGQNYVTGYQVTADTLADALTGAAVLVKVHEDQNHLVRLNIEWDAETFEHHVFLTVLN